ncbi:nucleotide-binding protein [Stenotrophomonas sp. ESTM1D_MKCIP4_1]|uniref:TIR domain-containing protein n=1 Tax=Stenotrophomonas sp. ESTM1D_MKCIP4_1 TaxID=2072414 RepID=UPI001C1F5436|nr:nucleotide-binding protein [Stenotrophomonas sp. ESTM1D_MKCIP4_1]
MEDIGVAMAQLAGIRKAVEGAIGTGNYRIPASEVMSLFIRANKQLSIIRASYPDLFGDIPDVPTAPAAFDFQSMPTGEFHKGQLQHLARTIDEVFEIRASSALTMPPAPHKPAPHRVFISHGRAQDWRAVQAYVEKDLGLLTMELAQEASAGRTIIEKLESGAEQCDSAVIVMTGDDADAEGQARARENVIHEIGYFHGRYGRSKVILLHEDGVSVPSNLSGIVYVPFPKGLIAAAESTLARELHAIYGGP